jgi:hypothetical protein
MSIKWKKNITFIYLFIFRNFLWLFDNTASSSENVALNAGRFDNAVSSSENITR